MIRNAVRNTVDAVVEKLFWRVMSRLIERSLKRDAHDITRCLQRRALEQSADFVLAYMRDARVFDDRYRLLDYALSVAPAEGFVAEFGVFQAKSLNYIAKKRPNSKVYGFDSFEGLPEDWIGEYSKGTFSLNKPPTVRKNVELVVGWYEDSIPPFVKDRLKNRISFLHIDCDLYSSTKTIFDNVSDHFADGAVIVFDEFYNYPGWSEDGEYKAFIEMIELRDMKVEYLGYCRAAPVVAARVWRN